ncbi:hypothetical protein FN846DRAFT_907162 [Sphaerosporella brunnea]|uniref:Uncharacterized protein n=1 Tax=Sphaerosporella brunnea TaxID=1250544 RepID=A0A5J5EX51_9PEZI|nr:hypothetical protein FN846DRAFT_907162 [Sphaerosporella brunnea]
MKPLPEATTMLSAHERLNYETFSEPALRAAVMEPLSYEDADTTHPRTKRYGRDMRVALLLLLGFVTLYLTSAFVFLVYKHASRFSLQQRLPASPLDSFINPKTSLAAAGAEFCRLFRDDDGRVGLYALKCRSGVGLDLVWSGNGSCLMLALGGDRWWQHARSWRVECGEMGERKWVGGIENGGARWEAWLE